MADFPGEKDLRRLKAATLDLANKLGVATTKAQNFGEAFTNAVSKAEDLGNRISDLAQKTELTAKESEKLKSLHQELDKATDSASIFANVLKTKLMSSFDKIGNYITKTWAKGIEDAFERLEGGIRRVYEYQERWTRAMGEFRTRMGAASTQMATASKLAAKWEGTMHALTGQFGQGIPMVAEFAEGLHRAIAKNDKDLVLFGLKVGRTFGMTTEQVSESTRAFENMGMSLDDQKKVWGAVADQADKAGLNLGQFSQELAHSREFMVRFGKTGQKVFVESAAFVRRLGVSLKSLEGFYDLTDTFDGATKAAARLNTTFGTTIDSLGLMLEQNPAKRFEMVRQSLIAQGKSMQQLMPQEVKLISETIGLTVDETNAMLKSGKTFEEYQAAKEKEVDVQKRVQNAMNKTALTMYSFSLAADKITVAIANAIKPFLQLIGLAKPGGKEFKSFGQVMESITQKIVGFFNALAKNDDWMDFMKKAAGRVKDIASTIGDYLSPKKIGGTIQYLIDRFKDVYTWSKRILVVWAAFRIGSAISSGIASIGKLRDAMQSLKSMSAGRQRVQGDPLGGAAFDPSKALYNGGTKPEGGLSKASRFLGGGKGGAALGALGGLATAAAGYKAGELSIGEAAGVAIGSTLGGAIAGPIGAAIGGWLGQKGGKLLETVVKRWTSSPAEKRLYEAQEARKNAEEGLKDSALQLAKVQADFDIALAGNTNAVKNLTHNHSLLNDQLEKELSVAAQQAKLAELQKKSQQITVDILKGQESKKEKSYSGAVQSAIDNPFSALFNMEDLKKAKKDKEELANIADKRATEEEKLEKLAIKQVEVEKKKNDFEQAQLKLRMLQSTDAYTKKRDEMMKDKSFSKLNSTAQTLKILEALGGEDAMGALRDLKQVGFAGGGIVSGPTRALLGEAGPEAVIPLRAMARGRRRNPSKFGGDAAAKLVNYAAGSSGGGTRQPIVIEGGDVYLDSRKVGRQMTRTLLVDVGE